MKINKILIASLAVLFTAGLLLPIGLKAQTGPGADRGHMGPGGRGEQGQQGKPQDTQALIAQLQEQIRLLQSQSGSLRNDMGGQVATIARNLGRGTSGDDVKVLQAVLASDSEVFPESSITGFFGAKTEDAVKRFQSKHGLEAVGFVGPRTLAAIRNVLSTNPIAFESDDSVVSDEDSGTASSTDGEHGRHGLRLCAKVPPGHLVAPGWLRHNGGIMPIVPECQTLPPGILGLLNGRGTTTASTTVTTVVRLRAIALEGVSSNSATVVWHTNIPASSWVYFGSTTPVNFSSAQAVGSNALVADHSVQLTSLATSTTYYYGILSRGANGNTATSSTRTFRTQ